MTQAHLFQRILPFQHALGGETTNPDVLGNHAETQAHTPGMTATLRRDWSSRQAMEHEIDTTISGFHCFLLINIFGEDKLASKEGDAGT